MNISERIDLVRMIAFYLPQFYPIPENDEWWGKGFTEWTNVAQARPLFKGHYQPRIPSELGFYDLRYSDVREKQAEMAKAHSLHGFCYYHYWIKGKKLLERPFSEVLSSGKPDLPFCLCWGNHNWNRRWDGREDELLIKQEYSPVDDRAHIDYLIPIFKDKRYITVAGKPFFAVYMADCLPDPERTTRLWRAAAKAAGLPGLYLANVENNFFPEANRLVKGFDATIEFAPDVRSLGPVLFKTKRTDPGFSQDMSNLGFVQNNVYLYDSLARNMSEKKEVEYKRFRGVCPGWDNSPRRLKIKGAFIFDGCMPDKYREFLEKALLYTYRKFAGEERLLFINAWNEWGEGCYLEPDRKFGRAYLQATMTAWKNTAECADPARAAVADEQYKYAHLTQTESAYEKEYLGKPAFDEISLDTRYLAQLFVDTGKGFNSQEAVTRHYYLKENGEISVRFDLKGFTNIKRLRLDPISDQFSVVEQLSITINSRSGQALVRKYRSNARYKQESRLIFDTVDPQVYFEAPDGIQPESLEVKFLIRAIGDRATSYLIRAEKNAADNSWLRRLLSRIKKRLTLSPA